MTGNKGLRQFLDPEQQRAWLEGEATPPDADERSESLEQRFKYAGRLEKLLQRPQAQDVFDILRLYAATCIPLPRATERCYWSVSCLPTSPDKPLVRVNAGWMELFALHADNSSPLVGEDIGGGPAASAAEKNPLSASSARAEDGPPPMALASTVWGTVRARHPHKGKSSNPQTGLRARIILHLSDFTADGSPESDHLDHALLESCVADPADVSHFHWKADTFGVKIRGAASIRAFLTHPHGSRAIRRFNLTHMNRGRNAYQASHCYSLADVMVGE